MKYLIAFVSSALAADVTICKWTEEAYADDDTECAGDVAATTEYSAIVGQCQFDNYHARWFSITACDATTISRSWFADDDTICANEAGDDYKADYTVAAACVNSSLYTGNTGSTTAEAIPAKVTEIEGDTDSTVCGFTVTGGWSANDCTGGSNDFTEKGFNEDGNIFIVTQCYYQAADTYYKVTTCAADAWNVTYYTTDACTTEYNSGTGAAYNSTDGADVCQQLAETGDYNKWGSVVADNEAVALVEEEDDADDSADDGAKALLASSLASMTLLYM